MLFSKNINPKKSIYYYGAMILKELQEGDELELMDLYLVIKQKHQISLMSFCLTMDWLYLIDSAKIDNTGKVVLCSLNS